ncbi:putative geraniol 8-hydroxylase [Iris pallida]|uniref:Geraniol 8-hydroxylase n=1 Tax=Iris pallida TaxID=29817 RepID=A0AAX6DVL2_IRIPA|nr:putative geraniol 8-hydroxylase [Iris pallida]
MQFMSMELSSSSSSCFLFLLFIVPFLYFLKVAATTSLAASTKRPRLAPGPTPLPIVGNLFELGDKPHRSLARLAKAHGPVMSLKLGRITTTVVSSPDAAKEALQKKGRALSGRWVPDADRVLGHDRVAVVWLPPSQQWNNLRAVMRTYSFAARVLDASQGLRRQKVRELISHVRGRTGRAVDVGGAVFDTALNLISATAFSSNLVSLDHSDHSRGGFKEVISGIMEEVGKPNLVDFFPLLSTIDPHGRRRKVTKYFKQLFGMIDDMIDDRLKLMKQQKNDTSSVSSDGCDLLDELLRSQLDRPILRSLLADYFIAGSDTSSVTVGWAMAELLRSPSLMAMARAELASVVGPTREVVESDIPNLSFLRAVVKETFRLHPTSPLLLPHRAEADVELGPYAVPKHSQVVVNVWAIGRDESVWEDAEAFKPERFLGSEVDFRGQHFELIPFGAGRRMCPGMPLADRMVHLTLASLIHSFEWRLPGGMKPGDVDLTEKFGVTLALAVPLLAIPLPVKE